jgi:hypothetical protein
VPVAGPVLHGNFVVWGTGSIEGGEPVEPIRIFGAPAGRIAAALAGMFAHMSKCV